ncbi:transporter substrate-binding domain-containing protein [uncultured Tateyamaria sp.]|uniref:substrate-binding periplasmic protein n=1 Tax=uncultured Tateyamaria sp. TaxID=455651 RepID=UPI0026337847|nr:transporter substrate-binding domain-containing protein [uncultured Tateyamaria sp.]
MLTLLVMVSKPAGAAAEDITVWVYHNYPPYVVDAEAEEGLSYDLARVLTDMAQGHYRFRVMVLPRQRLNQNLEAGQPGMVAWVNPVWFGDQDRTRFLWTDAILSDRNSVISPTGIAFDYTGPRSLTGMTMVGIRGHRYQDVDRLVAQGLVDRVDVRSEHSLVQFIASGRGRVAIIAHSAVQYYVQDLGLAANVHVSDTPHSRYQRHIMIQPRLGALHRFVQNALPDLLRSGEWAAITDRYGVSLSASAEP